MSTPHARWIHSSHAAVSPVGGMTWPWHSGQSGQPMPDPVLRTMTPMTTITKVETTARRAILWKRDIDSGPGRGSDGMLGSTASGRTGAMGGPILEQALW